MEKEFEYYLEMARTAIPVKKYKAPKEKGYQYANLSKEKIQEYADYLEASIDKQIDKNDSDSTVETSLVIKSFMEKHGFETLHDLRQVVSELNKRYSDWEITTKFGLPGMLLISKK